MACKVERFQSGGKGNGLRASSSVSPGEVLYVSEPFAHVLNANGRGNVCEFCLNPAGHLLRCSRCKFAKYCGKQCQTDAWPDHQRECKCLKSANFNTDPVRLVGRIVFKLLRKSPCPSEAFYSVWELESSISKQIVELKKELESFANLLQLYVKDEVADLCQAIAPLSLLELFGKVTCNRFSIVNGSMLNVAVGLYPSMSLINHSCEPNCVIVFMGRHLHLRAIRNIQVGEELTITYIEPLMPTAERQSQLKRKYCFECDCRRCRTRDKDDQMLAGDQKASDETKALASKVLELQSNQQWEASLSLCRAQLERNAGRVPDKNLHQLTLLDYAMEACLVLGLMDEALRFGARTLEPYRLYATGITPTRGLQMMKIGTMLCHQGKVPDAMRTFREAYDVMQVFYGRDHPMTQKLVRILG